MKTPRLRGCRNLELTQPGVGVKWGLQTRRGLVLGGTGAEGGGQACVLAHANLACFWTLTSGIDPSYPFLGPELCQAPGHRFLALSGRNQPSCHQCILWEPWLAPQPYESPTYMYKARNLFCGDSRASEARHLLSFKVCACSVHAGGGHTRMESELQPQSILKGLTPPV